MSYIFNPARGGGAFIDLTDTFASYTGLGGEVLGIKMSEDGIEPVGISATAWGTIGGTLSAQTDLNTALSGKVATTRTVNGHALSADVTVTKDDLGATTVGGNIFTLTNPSAISYVKIAADNTVSTRTLSQVKTDLDLTGTNSGDQTITLTGDITGSGTGSFATTIGAGKVSNAMLANSAVGNLSGTNSGDETTATIKSKLSITTLTGVNTGDQTITLTGDITGSGTSSFAASIGAGKVTYAMFASSLTNYYAIDTTNGLVSITGHGNGTGNAGITITTPNTNDYISITANGTGGTINVSAYGGIEFDIFALPAFVLSTSSTRLIGRDIWLQPGASGVARKIKFYEDDANGTNFTAFVGASTQAGDTTYILPNAYPGSNSYVLSSTTAGVLSWIASGSLAVAVTTGENMTAGDLAYISDSTGAIPITKKITAYVEGTNYTTAITGLDAANNLNKRLIPTSSGNYALLQYTVNTTTLDIFWIITSGTTVSSITRSTITLGQTIQATAGYPGDAYWDDANSRLIMVYGALSNTNLLLQGCAFSFNVSTHLATLVNEITIKDCGVFATAGTTLVCQLKLANNNLFVIGNNGSSTIAPLICYLVYTGGALTAGTAATGASTWNIATNNLVSIGFAYMNNKYWAFIAGTTIGNIQCVAFTGTSTITYDTLYNNTNALASTIFTTLQGVFYNYNNIIYYICGNSTNTSQGLGIVYKIWDNGSGLEIVSLGETYFPLLASRSMAYAVDTTRGVLISPQTTIKKLAFYDLRSGKHINTKDMYNGVNYSGTTPLFTYNPLSDYCLAYFGFNTTTMLMVFRPSNIHLLAGIIVTTATSGNATTMDPVQTITSNATGITNLATTDNVNYNENTNAYGSAEIGITIGKRLSTSKIYLQNPFL